MSCTSKVIMSRTSNVIKSCTSKVIMSCTSKVRLDKTDADYVDVIHSNGDSLIIGGLGAWEPIGTIDTAYCYCLNT